MPYSPFKAYVYAEAAPSYFADTRPAALAGNVQSIRFTEGQDANRPFQRFRPSQLDVETIIPVTSAVDRPYQAGYLVWLQVEVGTAAAATWFRGLMLTPKYKLLRQGRSRVRFSALDLSDVLSEEITVANQTNGTIAENFGLLLDGVGWPDDADWRDIDADLIEQLSSWAHSSGKAIRSAQELVDTVGPPARMVIRRNGGMRVIKDVADTPEATFTDIDVRNEPNLEQHEDSVINTVTIEGTTLGSISSTVRNRRPLDYDVLDGLAATERVNVIRRILRAYENGLTTIDPEFPADDDRNQAKVALLEPGRVIEYDSASLGQTFTGPVSGLRWRWEKTRAFVRANVVVQPPVPDVFGVRLYMIGTGSNQLYFVDVATGIATQIDIGHPGGHDALAYDPNNNILYSGGGRSVNRVNTTTGVGTRINAAFYFPSYDMFEARGLAYDSTNDILYLGAAARVNNGDPTFFSIYTVDVSDGALTLVPAFLPANFTSLTGLAFNSGAGVLYLTDGGRLAAVRMSDRTVLGNVHLTGDAQVMRALAYDDGNQVLYGLRATQGGLVTIDVSTGAGTMLGTTENYGLPATYVGEGLAYMSLGRVLAMPSGLSLTESGGDITANWDSVADATGYVLEWREEGSGVIWQTVDVTGTSHTFTP